MIAEIIIHYMCWEAVWCVTDYPLYGPFHHGWFVGDWTGPDHDLICVRRCDTKEEAERCLSPIARTILGAAVKSWLTLHRIRREDRRAGKSVPRHESIVLNSEHRLSFVGRFFRWLLDLPE